MCGIIVYKGKNNENNATKIVVEGLKKLEYRGYDSWGIATLDKNLQVFKEIRRIGDFKAEEKLGKDYVALGHTRWAKIENFKNNNPLNFNHYKNVFNLQMNILNLIKRENYYIQIDRSFQNLINKKFINNKSDLYRLNVSRKTLYRIRKKEGYWCNLNRLIKICEILKIKEEFLLKNILRIKTKNSFPIDFKDIQFNKSFARILGHILGDGGIYVKKEENKYRVFYVNNEQKLLNSFKSDIKKIFGNVQIYFRERKVRGNELWLPSTIGYIFYKILEYNKLRGKRIPSVIKHSDDEKIIKSFLQALYDDEGFLYPSKKMIVISLSHYELLNDIRRMIIKLRIKPNRVLIHKMKNRNKMYYFSITGKEDIVVFKKKINFLHPVKKEKLIKLLKSYQR